MPNQKNNEGFTRVPNNILEALLGGRFSERERRIIDLFLRFGFGCGCTKEISISKTEISVLCDMPKQDVNLVLSRLFKNGVFTYNSACKKLVFFEQPDLWSTNSPDSESAEVRKRLTSKLIYRSLKVSHSRTKKCVNSLLRVRKRLTFDSDYVREQAQKHPLKENI